MIIYGKAIKLPPMKAIDLSIIIPFYNEEKNVVKLHRELFSIFTQTNLSCELIFVDDGSTDHSSEHLIREIKKSQKKLSVKLVSLRKNFGQTAAISAGIDKAKGRLICLMDADLQNDPKDILVVLKRINQKEGYDIVIGWRKNRQDNFLRSFLSKAANFLIQKMFNIPFHDLGCSLKMIRRDTLEGLHLYGESHRILPLILYWRGGNILEIVVSHRKRFSGNSKYGYSRIIKLIIDIVTVKFLNSYGTKPSYVFGTIGIFSNLAGGLLLTLVLFDKLFQGVYVHRNPLFLIAIFLIMLGVQFLLMGLLAELLVRTYFETQKKTIYEIKKVTNL